MPLVNEDGKIFGVLAGHPNDPNWPEIHRLAAAALEERRCQCRVSEKNKEHRRGHFKSLRCGVSHGGGQSYPKNLHNTKANEALLEELNNLKPFRRLVGFSSSVLSTWAPGVHQYYIDYLGKLYEHHPELKRTFRNSIFPAPTYNFGRQTVCYRHIDYANLPFGWCSITALGSFDHTKGGHLVLWDCRLVIEFPAGSTILIPSGILSHSNTTISDDEKRYSFTQYAARGLFRWVENGFQTLEERKKLFTKLQNAKAAEEDSRRWIFGLSLLSNYKYVPTEPDVATF
ncbi:hypothetical protein CPC08DRAFT_737612 [Agrocybe pediades]|nr:hypothetical protein CPC08DRAFT_737612 [Agrocybe pediades]